MQESGIEINGKPLPCGQKVHAFVYRDNVCYYRNVEAVATSHRDNGPSLITNSGQIVFSKDGCDHREEGPAIYYPNGRVYYYIRGETVEESDFYARAI